MAESQDRSSDALPNLGDEEEAGESTIAMASPAFDPNSPSAPPLPISTPPPGFPAPVRTGAGEELAAEDLEEAAVEDGPTMSDPLNEIDSLSLAEAARAASGDARRSPLANTGFAAPASSPKPAFAPPRPGSAPSGAPPSAPRPPRPLPRLSDEPEAATLAIPKEDLKPIQSRYGAEDDETRTVARDELVRSQDAHVIVGADAIGDEATLAVLPGDNQASNQGGIAAALAETLGHKDEPVFPAFPGPMQPPPQQHQPGMAGAIPMGHRPNQGPTAMGLAPPPGPPPGAWTPPSSGAMQAAAPHAPHAPYPPPYSQQQQQPSGIGRTTAGMAPNSFGAPPQSMGQPFGQPPPMSMPMPMSMQAPMHPGMQQPATQQLPLQPLPMHSGMQHGMQQGGMPPPSMQQPAPQQLAMQQPAMQQPALHQRPPAGAPTWGQPAQPPAKPSPFAKVSGQMILLVVVGAVCLAIFITGIVLFATTRF